MSAVQLDGVDLLGRVTPKNSGELGEIIRQAVSQKHGLYPWAGGAYADVGLPPSKPGQLVDLSLFSQVIEHADRDMTITTQTGISIAQLQATLAKAGQQLPVDLPNPDKLSLGAALALNLSGPRRLFSGTLRDYLIGISFMTDAGDEVKGGGRVVKNVAGYDLMKLQIGAVGTLGILTQATLKVIPKPEDQAAIAFGLNTTAIGPTLDRLHASNSRPVFVELLNTASARMIAAQAGVKLPEFESWVLVVGFEEKAKTVDWQVATLKEELKTSPAREVMDLRGPTVSSLITALGNFQAHAASKFIWKVNVLPSKLAEFINKVATDAGLLVQAQALNGIVWLQVASEEYDPTSGSRLTDLDQAAMQAGGNVIVRRCPMNLKKGLRIWGRPTADQAMMRTVKQTLDPNDVFNSGRLFG